MTRGPRRQVPRTDDVLADARLAPALARLGRHVVKAAVQHAQERVRGGELGPDQVVDATCANLPAAATGIRAVVNATGVLVHTNLGRAPLSSAAVDALRVAAGATDVEYDLTSGSRGPRGASVLAALREAVPAAEDAHVVNNNAGALLLCALALAADREIIISRGEMVEIGDGFRIPELLAATGARIREVGTTNRTTVADYREALGPDTGFVLKVHPSNFVVRGFTAAAGVAELAQLCATVATPETPLVVDIGSGLLRPHQRLPDEPDADSMLRAGAGLVTASADKLLGGPQAGLLFGARELVTRLRRFPAARALRVDKLTLAALEATVRGPRAPVHGALEADEHEVRARADGIAERLRAGGLDANAVSCQARVGGGGAPDVELPSAAVSLPVSYAEALRAGERPVIARVERDRCLLDLRTVDPDEDDALADLVLAAGRCGS